MNTYEDLRRPTNARGQDFHGTGAGAWGGGVTSDWSVYAFPYVDILWHTYYIPLIALMTCLQILKSKENKKYKFLKNLSFISIFFVIIISEVSLRYSSYNLIGLLFFTLFPIVSFFTIYLILIRRLNYKIILW